MKKAVRFGILLAALSAAFSVPALAAQWEQDGRGYYWQEDDGSYPTNQWKWLDGNGDGISECYYFDQNGYMAHGTFVDGYQVNDGGAWVVNGVTQTKKSWALVKDSGDPKEIVAAVTELNQDQQSMDMGFFMNMQMSDSTGYAVDMNASGDMKLKNALSEEMQYIMNMNMQLLGESISTTAFYADGWYYYDTNGQKLKMEMPYQQAYQQAMQSGELASIVPENDFSYLRDLSVARNGEDITVYYTVDASQLMDELDDVWSSMGLSMSDLGMDMDIAQYKGEFTVDQNGAYKQQRALMDMNMAMEGETLGLHLYMEANIHALGDGVSFTLPSTDGYQDFYEYLGEALGALE